MFPFCDEVRQCSYFFKLSERFVNFQIFDKSNPANQYNTVFNYSLYLGMGASEIITEINRISREEKREQLRMSADKLYNDYMNDPELTAFTILDQEDFVLSIKIK